MKTIILSPQTSLQQDMGAISCRFSVDGVSIEINCRILEASHSDRKAPDSYNHPEPPFCRMFLFKEGEARLKMAGKTHRLVKDRIYLLPATVPFKVRYFNSFMVYFHLHIFDHFNIPVFDDSEGLLILKDPQLFNRIIEAEKTEDQSRIYPEVFSAVCALAGDAQGPIAERAKRAGRFSNVLSWLQEQPPADLSVGMLAEKIHMSRAALSKGIRRSLGISLKDYIRHIHLQKAKELLLYTDKTVQEIATLLGHNDPHYFYRVFKKHTGLTPSEYRIQSHS